jgi:hypothetical protein
MRLEEAQLADTLGADPAGGEVGDAARFEFHAHIRDVNLLRQDRQADGADFLHRRFDE